MKKLQNNFTTPEQSKRLLELGVPAWTADCYYYEEGGISKDSTPNILSLGYVWTDESIETMFSSYVDVPCWSVGRLMEMTKICITDKDALTEIFELLRDCTFITRNLCQVLDEYSDVLDFSKLED